MVKVNWLTLSASPRRLKYTVVSVARPTNTSATDFKVSEASGGTTAGIAYRGTSLIRNTPFLGPYRRTIPGVLRWSKGGGLFLMSEVLLYPLPSEEGTT